MFDKKFSVSAFSMSAGIIVSIHLGILGLLGFLGIGEELVSMIGSVLPGYDTSGGGIFIIFDPTNDF